MLVIRNTKFEDINEEIIAYENVFLESESGEIINAWHIGLLIDSYIKAKKFDRAWLLTSKMQRFLDIDVNKYQYKILKKQKKYEMALYFLFNSVSFMVINNKKYKLYEDEYSKENFNEHIEKEFSYIMKKLKIDKYNTEEKKEELFTEVILHANSTKDLASSYRKNQEIAENAIN